MLNEKSIEFLEEKLKLDSGQLKEIINDESERDIMDIDIPIKHFFTEEDRVTLESNIKKKSEGDSYKKAKAAAIEMTLKDLNKKHKVFTDYDRYTEHGFDVEKTSFDDFVGAFQTNLKSDYEEKMKSLKSQLDGNESEEIEKITKKLDTLRKEKEDLKTLNQTIKSEFEKEIEKRDMFAINTKKDDIWNRAINSIPIDTSHIDSEEERVKYLQRTKQNLLTLTKTNYNLDFEEDKPVIFKGDEKLVNDLKDPLAPEDVILNFAKENYIKLEQQNKSGRGGHSSSFGSMTVRNIKSVEDFNSYCQKNEIQPNSRESDALHAEIVKYNPEYNKR